MKEPWVYLNGEWLKASKAGISLIDAGFVLGVTIAEQMRTFSGKIFRLEDHLARLGHSLQLTDISPPNDWSNLVSLAQEIVSRNLRLLDAEDDVGLSIFITPGEYSSYTSTSGSGRPTVCLHTYPLPFRTWAEKYRVGQSLATTTIRQVPKECWPAEIKCRSRMHYFLADREATRKHPGSRAVLTDREGYVTEASTANLLIYRRDGGLISPPQSKILHGISLMELLEIARKIGISCVERDFKPEEVAAADEVILSSTPFCLLPCTQFNGLPIADGRPGEIFHRLLAAWSEIVGIDILQQAERFSER